MSVIIDDFDLAINCLQQGGLVAIPTETVYGLAANAQNEQAVRSIFALKNRPLNHPLILHVADGCDLMQWVSNIPDYAYRLINAYWPGPLTLVLRCKEGAINPLITGGQQTIAIRCPNHPLAQSLLHALDFPLVAPSANPFGKISPTTAQHVQQSFANEPLYILDGGRCMVGIESTIVAATEETGYQILRHGVIDEQAIHAIMPHTHCLADAIRVSGKLASHYKPDKPLYCFADAAEIQQFLNQQSAQPYIISFSKKTHFDHYPGYELSKNAQEVAYELYYQLRLADKSSAAFIAMELPEDREEWQGIRERILKACTYLSSEAK